MVSVRCPACDHPAAPDAAAAGVCARCGVALTAMPAIDVSRLTTLDDLGTPPRARAARGPAGSPVRAAPGAPPADPFAPPRDAFAPPRDTFAPPPDVFAPPVAPAARPTRSGPTAIPSSAAVSHAPPASPAARTGATEMPSSMFAPPLAPDQAANDDQEIGVERSTRAIRIANQ